MIYAFNSYAQNNEEADIKAINKVLKKRRIAWSNNDLEGYMEGYWKSDSLKFYGANGVIKKLTHLKTIQVNSVLKLMMLVQLAKAHTMCWENII